MIYLASPYSHPDALQMKTRFLLAEQCTAALLQRNLWVYSPIVHCHAIAEKYQMPSNFEFWRRYNMDMLRRADLFGVLKIRGWDQSVGVREELEMARQLGMQVAFYNEDGEEI